MSKLFDDVAGKFAHDIDTAMHKNHYVRGKIFAELAKKYIPSGGEVLDYGCGPGRLSFMLANLGLKVRGVDTSAGMIGQAQAMDRQALNIKFDVIDDFKEVLVPNAYDAIVCSSVVEYIEDVDELLQGLRLALRSSGVLIISYANRSSLWRQHWTRSEATNPMGPGQHHVWSKPEFRALLVRNGFNIMSRPKFFESPSERWPWGALLRHSPYVGSLGVLVASAAIS